MRARNIKPGLFKNEVLGEADPIYTLLFAGLWTLADKEGRLEYRPKRIKAELFPYRPELDVSMALDWLKHESFINVYEIDQKSYIQINNWKRHQSPHHKEVDSEIPAPPKPEKQPKKQEDSQACAKHEPTMSQPCAKKIASSPLIPDSGFSDSGFSDSSNKPIRSESAKADPKPPDKKSKPKKFKFKNHHHELAVRMSNPVVCRFPSQKINLDEWADCIRKLIDIDGHSRDQIIKLWHWVVNHERGNFSWADNCRTPMKLREKKQGLSYFEIIRTQMERESAPPQHPPNRHTTRRAIEDDLTDRSWAVGMNSKGG